jgi:4-hydroxy-tetrahydrodipicolinate reductase
MKNSEPLLIGLIGASGRMGKAILALESKEARIAASFTRENPPDPGAKVDLFLDVSSIEALDQNLKAALLAKKPIVIGTTGHPSWEKMRSASQTIPVFYSANFNLNVALMRKMAEDLARRFPLEGSIELTETHHAGKKDAPSGTALMLAQAVEKIHPSRVKIRSIRTGQIVGKHELTFQSADESFSLIHDVLSRDAFARGSLVAARFLAEQCPGFYTMDDLLK